MINLSYNGKSFNQRENDGYVNLGQLCATHGKKFSNWIRLNSAEEYLSALAETLTQSGAHICTPDELVISGTNAIGGNSGTWGHPLVAIEVARWISPSFGVWCNQHIKTLVETGSTTIATQPPQQPAPQQLPQVTAIALAGLDAALSGVINPSLLAGVKLNAIAALHPETNIALEEGRKLLSHDTITQGQLLTPTELGERLGISARKVNQLLIEKGLQIKNPDQHKGASAYLPTDKGLEFAEFTLATGRKGDNTSYQHIKWYPNVARVLNPQISVVA